VQIVLYVIGKTNLTGVQSLIDEYTKRLTRFCKYEMLVLPDVKNSASLTKEILMQKEGEVFLATLKPNDFVVLLDENGNEFSSIQLSDKMQEWMNKITGRLVFIIGGAYGFSEAMYARSGFKLSLSKLTFNHQMVRAVFCEQVYRVFTIMNGLPYHHH